MKEKIFEWGNVWGMNVGDYYETDRFAWFKVDTDLSIRMIKSLEVHVNAQFDSVEWAKNNKLEIWLNKNVKGE